MNIAVNSGFFSCRKFTKDIIIDLEGNHMKRNVKLFAFIITVAIIKPGIGAPDSEILISKESSLYNHFKGVSSLRESTIREYDTQNGKLISVSKTIIRRKDFFYKEAELTVVKYIKNGVEKKPSEYPLHNFYPAFPICDAQALQHYSFADEGAAVVDGVQCRMISVTPKMKSARHFQGNAFADVHDGHLVKIDGAMSTLPMGVTSLRIMMMFWKTKDGSVPHSGTYELVIDIPIIMPHRKFVTEFSAQDVQLIN